ncbi:MAG: low molecular weight protein tyrosine phosphatase family protein [Limisphaerales bacterium]
MEKPHLLFVCGRNQWRSPTAEAIYRNDPRVTVRSAGLSAKSPHPLSARDLEWADLVLVMEREHKTRIVEKFREQVNLPRIVSLDIPDEYNFMDPELITLLKQATEFHLQQDAERE